MHTLEKTILREIEQRSPLSSININYLLLLPLGSFSEEFCNSRLVQTYFEQQKDRGQLISNSRSYLGYFRFILEKYLRTKSEIDLNCIESFLISLKSSYGKQEGTQLLSIPSSIIQNMYMLDDAKLTGLCITYLPIPPSHVFKKDCVPEIIKSREQATEEIVNKLNVQKLEPGVIRAQRLIRMKNRNQEEINRIALRDKDFLEQRHKETENDSPIDYKTQAKQLLQDANTPYSPRCKPDLAKRIMDTARHVSSFSTIKHITSDKSLVSILDQALYGRRTLLNFFLPFNPAALQECDILNGDGNVICMGPQEIDPQALGNIIIEFDLPKLIATNPAAFYKQRDLEYQLDKIREIRLGQQIIYFDHTGFVRCADPLYSYLQIMPDKYGEVGYQAELPKSLLIAYNLEKMHEILTLNFFRFIDAIPDEQYVEEFYKNISQLNDKDLLIFLTEVEKNLTDTAEFNFYGAHQVDFSTIINIHNKHENYTLCLPNFIEIINKGNIEELRLARYMIPNLFQSYRFIDYLLEKVHDAQICYYLNDLRSQCVTPSWIKYLPLPVNEQFEISWTLSTAAELEIPSDTKSYNTNSDGQKEQSAANVSVILAPHKEKIGSDTQEIFEKMTDRSESTPEPYQANINTLNKLEENQDSQDITDQKTIKLDKANFPVENQLGLKNQGVTRDFQSHNVSYALPIDMQLLGTFIVVIGIGAVAIALSILSTGILPVAGIGGAAILVGLGLFAADTRKKNDNGPCNLPHLGHQIY